MSAKTRSDGEGSIYQRKDGKWVASISLGKDHTGKRMRRTRIAKNKKQALAKLRELQEFARNANMHVDERITLSDFCHLWCNTIIPSRVTVATASDYRDTLDRWVLPHVGHIPLIEFTSEHYARLQQKLLDSRLKPVTVRHARRPLHACMNQAVRMGRIKTNPVSAIPQPRLNGPGAENARRLTRDEANMLIATLADAEPNLAAIVALALMRGMRRGEVLALAWEDIDTDKRVIHVRRNLREERIKAKDGSYVVRLTVKDPKTKTSTRDLILNEQIVGFLKRVHAQQAEHRLRNGPEWNTPYVFTTDVGKLLWPSNVYSRFRTFLKRNGLPMVSLHDLRRTHAKLSIEGGARLEQVSETLGHASVETTKSIYIGSVPMLSRRALEHFDAYMDTTASQVSEVRRLH